MFVAVADLADVLWAVSFYDNGNVKRIVLKNGITILDTDMGVLRDYIEAALAKTGKKPPVPV
ncbi:MAG: hypothetical protein U0Z75_01300 [Deinococcaceae bacterium]